MHVRAKRRWIVRRPRPFVRTVKCTDVIHVAGHRYEPATDIQTGRAI